MVGVAVGLTIYVRNGARTHASHTGKTFPHPNLRKASGHFPVKKKSAAKMIIFLAETYSSGFGLTPALYREV